MEIKGTYTFSANPQAVWDGLHNSAYLKDAIPGAQEVAWQGDSALNLHANFGVGPLSRTFYGTVPVTEHTPPSHLKIEVHRDLVDGFVTIDLAPQGTGTLLTYLASFNLSGPLGPMAAMAQPMVSGQLNQVFARLNQQIH
jgi:carbon monoxide dehydrogenase subunit G